jgi:sialate O-acetylesterase
MVLQRNSRITVWGWANSGEKVLIRFHGQQATANTNSRGQWSIAMGPFSAGGPYDIMVRGNNTIEVHDVLIGDIWVASGQSNMEFPVKSEDEGVDNADRELAGANFPQIRLFLAEQNVALKPADDVMSKAGWCAVTPESAANFLVADCISAITYRLG